MNAKRRGEPPPTLLAAAPFNGFLDAPFFPDADRKGVNLNNALNSELLDAVAETCVRLCGALRGR